MKGIMRIGLCLVTVLALNGCAWFMSDITKVDMRIVAAGDVNLDDGGRPSPVVVRLLELKAPTTFQSADFFALYQDEKQTLGGDWVAREEFEFKPGDVQDLRFALQPESSFVAILAGYRQMDKVNWRLVLPIRLKEKNELTVLLNSRGIELATQR
jgi:type VI secretion system protein VasD